MAAICSPLTAEEPQERLTLQLRDAATSKSLSGSIRITRLDNGKHVRLSELIRRPNGWYTTQGTAHISVPAAKLKIEALRGLQT